MKAYIISITATTVISAVVAMITPEKWSKYVSIVTGIVVTVCIARPIISLMRADVFEGFSYVAQSRSTDGEAVLYARIKKELENRIKTDAQTRLKTEFNKTCEVDVDVRVDATGAILGVKSIFVYGDKIDAVVIGRLREVYDAEEVKYVRNKKTTQKSE